MVIMKVEKSRTFIASSRLSKMEEHLSYYSSISHILHQNMQCNKAIFEKKNTIENNILWCFYKQPSIYKYLKRQVKV